MSILIKGMEMPTSCMLCSFCVEEADPANGEMCMVTGTLMPPCTRERLDNCPLAPVPPHGRLIDADAFKARMMRGAEDARWDARTEEIWLRVMDATRNLCLDVDEQPTIIPAEEGE